MSEKLANIPIELLIPPFVLLRLVDRTSLDYIEMRDSIAAHGFFGSICVRKSKKYPNKYEIINGLHRYCCAIDCGMEDVPCIIKEATDTEVKNWQIQANLLRRETKNADYATRLKMLIVENPELTMEVLSAELHCRPGKLQKILKLTRLIPVAKKQLNDGNLPLTSAYALARLPKRLQEDLFEKATTLSVRDFVQICTGYSKSYKEAVNEGRLQKYLHPNVNPNPYLRSFKQIKNEYFNSLAGKLILEETVFSNNLEIWKAALAWVLHLDSISVEKAQQEAIKRSDIEKRRLTRRTESWLNSRELKCDAKKLGIDPDDRDMREVIV